MVDIIFWSTFFLVDIALHCSEVSLLYVAWKLHTSFCVVGGCLSQLPSNFNLGWILHWVVTIIKNGKDRMKFKSCGNISQTVVGLKFDDWLSVALQQALTVQNKDVVADDINGEGRLSLS